jgi:hypothetical protein
MRVRFPSPALTVTAQVKGMITRFGMISKRRASGRVLRAPMVTPCPLSRRSPGLAPRLAEQLAHARRDGLVPLLGGVRVDECGPGVG